MDILESLQDVVMVHSSPYQTGGSGLGYNLAVFAVADGHNGSAAALHCQEALYRELMQHMPTKPPPIAPGTDGVYSFFIFCLPWQGVVAVVCINGAYNAILNLLQPPKPMQRS